MRRLVSLALLVAVCSGVAYADPTTGTYRSSGNHSSYGNFTGEVTLERSGAGYAIRGSCRFTNGKTITYSGTGQTAGATKLDVTLRYSARGLSGALGGETNRAARGRYVVATDGKLKSGDWQADTSPRHRVRDTLTLSTTPPPPPVVPTPTSVAVDLVASPDGKALAEDKEETDGVALAVNLDDDDNDGGRAGDGENRIVRDHDDPDGTSGENDLVALRFARPAQAPAGATLRLVFPAQVAVYADAQRRTKVASGASLPLADGALFLEGREATARDGVKVTLEVVVGGQVAGTDTVAVKVARSAFLLCGHGCTGRWFLDGELRTRALDKRTNPAFVRGAQGDVWAVYVWDAEKGAKLALSTPGAVISYDGHSNFGMGFAFKTNFKKLSEFMNIADPMIPVNWPYLREHQEHPGLEFDEATEYGDDLSTPAKFDPVASATVIEAASSPLRKTRWLLNGGSGTRYSLTRGTPRFHDHHFGDGEGARIVVRAGAKDMPDKRWSKLFLNSCYSGGYYIDSFGGHGTLFFSTDEASSSKTSGLFLLGYVDGKTDAQVLEALNAVEDINDYKVFGATP
jgi:hypothetical protein